MAKDRGPDRNKLQRTDKPDAGERRTIETRLEAIEQIFSGPLPQPEILHGYGPDWGERIVRMAEEDAADRRAQNRQQLETWRTYVTNLSVVPLRAQRSATIIAVLELAVAAYAISQHETAIGVTALTSLAATIGAYVLKGHPSPRMPKMGEDSNSDGAEKPKG